MRLSDFDYNLPEELIAQEPPVERDAARMLVVDRREQRFEDRHFRELPSFLHEGDCVVLNDSRVLPSRLFGHREKLGGVVEMLLLEPVSEDAREWRALVRPGRKMRIGESVRFDDRFSAEITGRGERGERTVRFLGDEDVYPAIDRLGHVPLPP
jgi:S-adenosylmethionine:tRNA ribosyltransferase-isomerase